MKKHTEIWSEILDLVTRDQVRRLLCRLKRHAQILSVKLEDGKYHLLLHFENRRKRINAHVLMTAWLGKCSYRSSRVPTRFQHIAVKRLKR